MKQGSVIQIKNLLHSTTQGRVVNMLCNFSCITLSSYSRYPAHMSKHHVMDAIHTIKVINRIHFCLQRVQATNYNLNVIDTVSSWPLAVQIYTIIARSSGKTAEINRIRPPFDKLTSNLHMLLIKDHRSLKSQYPPQIRLAGQIFRLVFLPMTQPVISDHSELVVLSSPFVEYLE